MNLKSIELFAGIGGFRIACDNLGIETIWANDIDDKASLVYNHNFRPQSLIQGDIRQLYESIPPHDILTGGFPCQPFSAAGKKQGIRDPRGTLFEIIVEIIKNKNPRYFVLENVKRLLLMESGQHFATILDSLSTLGYLIEWRVLNSLNFGLPQNRERVVIIGSKTQYPTSVLLTKQEIDFVNQRTINYFYHPESWKILSKHDKVFEYWGVALNGKFLSSDTKIFPSNHTKKRLKDILQGEVDESFDFTVDTIKRIPNSNLINKYVNGVEIIYNQGGGARMGYTIFGTNGIAPTLTSSTSRHYERYKIGDRFRRLTNIEYARLQGFPDNHCANVSIYDQYSLYGNAVPPPLIQWAIDRLINGKRTELNRSVTQF